MIASPAATGGLATWPEHGSPPGPADGLADAVPGLATVIGAAALGAAAMVLIASARRRPRRRVTSLAARPAPASTRSRSRWLSNPIRLASVLAGIAVALGAGGWAGAVGGAALAVCLDRGLRRLEPRSVRREKAAIRAGLPFAADLLAAVLRSGAPTAQAVEHVGRAVGGQLGDRLCKAARGLALGAPAAEAWAVLDVVPEAAPLVRGAVRASESGAALAGVCARLAAELRAGQESASDAAARRAGVLVVLPLGCCFLPAFVLLGVVPVVLGVLDGVLL